MLSFVGLIFLPFPEIESTANTGKYDTVHSDPIGILGPANGNSSEEPLPTVTLGHILPSIVGGGLYTVTERIKFQLVSSLV